MRWHRLPLMILLVALVPVTTATAALSRGQSVTEARIESSVVAANGGVYVAAFAVVTEQNRGYTQDATLVALDPATGAERWRFAPGDRFMTAPVLAGGLAYVHVLDYSIGDASDNTGTLYAVDAATGQERWRFEAGAPYSPPVVADGVVYAAGGEHLYALDAASGTERWRRQDVPPLANPLAVDQDAVYITFISDECAAWHFAAFDAATGAERSSWEIEIAGNCAFGGPVVADGVAYIVGFAGEGGQGGGYLAALDAATGAEHWRWAFDAGGPPVTLDVHAGTVYATEFGALHAVDAAGGAERWNFGASGIVSPAVADNGTVYVASFVIGEFVQAALHAIDDATGTERWHFLTEAVPTFAAPNHPTAAAAEGVAYVGAGETVYAVDAASGAERWRARLALALPTSTPEGDPPTPRPADQPDTGLGTPSSAPTGATAGATPAPGSATTAKACAGVTFPAVGALRLTDGAVAWSACSPDEAYRTVIGASDDVVLVEERGPTGARTIAFAAADGSERWRRSTADAPTPPGPFDGQGIVVLADRDARALVGIDPATGAERWRAASSDAPLAHGATVAVVWLPVGNFESSRIRGIDRATGAELWVGEVPLSNQSGEMVGRSPAAVLGEVLVVPTGETITAVDMGTGATLWQAPRLDHLAAADGVVVGLRGAGGPPTSIAVVALDAASGQELGTAPGFPSYGGILAVGDGAIVVRHADRPGLVAYELASGNERWRAAQPPPGEPQLIVGTSLVLLWEGALAVVSTVDGATIWSATEPFGSPLMNSAGSNGDAVFVAINSLPWRD